MTKSLTWLLALALLALAASTASAQTQNTATASRANVSKNAEARNALLTMHEELQQDLAKLEALYKQTSALNEELAARIKELEKQISECSATVVSRGEVAASTDNKVQDSKTARVQMNRSYDLQYLQMQQKIQQESREFNMLSNIMKTKHEAAKNAINNIR